jgi:WD40 repeat protein
MTPCPARELLQQLLADQLAGPQAEALEAHVEGCSSCQQLLEQWTRSTDDGQGEEQPALEESGAAFLRRLERDQAAAARACPTGAAALTPLSLTRQLPAPTDLPAVPGYDILGELGRGGMGIVYKARQKGLGRLVALKMVLLGEHASAEQLARFRSEARAAARLQHPNIVQVHEVGEHAGRPYFSLELVDGGSLAQRLGGVPQSPRPAAELLVVLARAMHAAHQAGILHRDLKPANVLLTGDGTPKITDFGLAKQLPGPGESAAGGTASGAIVGTPSYMAPEQATARKEIGPAVDTYALGAILYELLTGRPPFRGETPLDTLQQVVSEEPVPPRRLQPKVPRDLETVCLKCLAKEPARRYAGAADLADDLRRFLDHRPVRARRAGAAERLWRLARRYPVAAALTAAATLSLVAGTLFSLYFAVQAGHSATRADQERQRADQERQRADERTADAEAQLYVAHMNLAQLGWDDNQLSQALALLDRWRQPSSAGRDLRGWEWHLLDRQCHAELLSLAGNHSSLRGLAYSPDGRWLAVGEAKGVRLRDAASGREVRTLAGPSVLVTVVAFSPDSQKVAAGTMDNVVWLWDAPTGRVLRTLTGHTHTVTSLAFTPDGTRLASSGLDRTARLWDVESGRELRTVGEVRGGVNGLAACPDGQTLALLGDDIELWDSTGERLLRRLGHAGLRPAIAAFSPDGTLLAAEHDNVVHVYDVRTGEPRFSYYGHSGQVLGVAYSPDGGRLASCAADQSVRVWDARTGHLLRTFKGHTAEVQGVAFAPDSRRVASAAWDGTVRVWDAGGAPNPRVLGRSALTLWRLAFTPDGRRLASAGDDGAVQVWDVADGRLVLDLPSDQAPLTDIALSPDGRWLAAAGRGPDVVVRDASSGREALRLKGHIGMLRGVAFSPDATRLASVSIDRTLRVWDLAAAREALPPVRSPDGLEAVAWSPAGTVLATAGGQGAISLWDPGSGQRLRTLEGHSSSVKGLAFSRDGARLASAGSDQTVRVWDPADGRELLVLRGHAAPVNAVSFNPEGTRLASAGSDNTVRVWDLATGQGVYTLRDFAHPVTAVAFSPDGRLLAATDGPSIKIWDGTPR